MTWRELTTERGAKEGVFRKKEEGERTGLEGEYNNQKDGATTNEEGERFGL